MKATVKHISKTTAQLETDNGLLVQIDRKALDEACAFGYGEDSERGLIAERRESLDADGVWVYDRRGNGLRSFAIRVTF